MQKNAVALVVLAALALVPMTVSAATSGNAVLRFNSPSELIMALDAELTGEDAAELREQLDTQPQNGGDGQVTAAEVEAAESAFIQLFSMGGQSDNENMMMDEKGSNSLTATKIDIQNAEGPATSTAPVQFDLELKFGFPVTAGGKHVFKTNSSSDSFASGVADVVSAKLVAPPGYVIESTANLPEGASVSGNKKEINFGNKLASSAGALSVTFTKGGGGSPGLVAPVVLLALIAGLVLARGRQPSA